MTVQRAGLGAAALLLAAWSLGPVAWQLSTALKAEAQITSIPTVYLPSPPTTIHFETLFDRKPFGTYLANSLLVSACGTLFTLGAATLAAWAMQHFAARHRERLLLALLLMAVFPPILLLFPLYEGVRAVGALNHPAGLIVPYAALALPLAVWILESGFARLPRELDEAARLDGLGPLGRLVRIQLPLVAPELAAAAILSFIFCWNEFMLALTFMTRDARKTVTAGIASVGGSSIYEIPWGQLAAAVIVATAPLFVLVLSFERRIAAGLTRGAVKG